MQILVEVKINTWEHVALLGHSRLPVSILECECRRYHDTVYHGSFSGSFIWFLASTDRRIPLQDFEKEPLARGSVSAKNQTCPGLFSCVGDMSHRNPKKSWGSFHWGYYPPVQNLFLQWKNDINSYESHPSAWLGNYCFVFFKYFIEGKFDPFKESGPRILTT